MSEAADHFNGPDWSSGALALAILSILALLLSIPPLVWHFRRANIAATSLILWPIILCLFNIINVFIWHNDNLSSWWLGGGLCDVEVKIEVASFAGFNCALATIVRSLAKVMDTKRITVAISGKDWRRESIIQCIMCWACPVYLMIAHYFVQPTRYYIFAIAGCVPSFDDSWLPLLLIHIWPILFALIGVFYAALLIYRLHRYRRDFANMLRINKTTKSRFLRLFVLSMVMITAFLPLSVYVFYNNSSYQFQRYSWSRVHDPHTWNKVDRVATQGDVFYDRWFRIAAAFICFAFFGIGDDAVNMYKGWLVSLGFGKIFPSVKDRRPSTTFSIDNTQISANDTGSAEKTTFFKNLWRRSKEPLLPSNATSAMTRSSIASTTSPFSPVSYTKFPEDIELKMPPKAVDALRKGEVVVQHELWQEEGAAQPEKSLF